MNQMRRRFKRMRRTADEAAAATATQHRDLVLATVGHELRSPLAAIDSAVQALRQTLTIEQNRALDVIARQTDHIARLVNDLVDTQGFAKGTIAIKKEPVSLQTVLARAIEVTQPMLDAQEQQLSLDIPLHAINVEADPLRLIQLVANLIDNAAKYSPRGSTIELAAVKVDGHVSLRISDPGIGIPADRLTDVFEPFVRLDGGRDASRRGLGLGLTLVRQLAELHGGTIQVASGGEGHGSEFTVTLPASK